MAAKAGIPTFVLMEHAGLETARQVHEVLGGVDKKKILVLCGPGNNGGDGLAAARVLHDWGARVHVYLLANEKMLKGDTKTNVEILKGISENVFITHGNFHEVLAECHGVVDAIFGIGLTRFPDVEVSAIMQEVNESGKPVISIDLPSGTDGDTGKVFGQAIKAAVTVTLAVGKPGLYLYPAKVYVGTLKTAYIGIPPQFSSGMKPQAEVASSGEVGSWIPRWKPDIHKGERGRVMILGGSRGLSGAPALSATAALHSGSGLVYLGVPDGIRTLMEHKLTEVIKVGISQSNNWVFGKASLAETRVWFEKIDALAIGPGAGRSEETQEYVKTVISEFQGSLVVDADALFPLGDDFLKRHGNPSMILTPHAGEMARLCGLTPEKVEENRFELAIEKAKLWNVTLVLKGASTLIVSGDLVWINPTGNAGMATAGSGDVLTGIVVSLLGQGLEPLKAAVAGTFIHGLAGDLLACRMGERGVTAEGLALQLWEAFKVVLESYDRKSGKS